MLNLLAPSLTKIFIASAGSTAVVGKLAATPDIPDPSPKKEPLKEPEIDTPESPSAI